MSDSSGLNVYTITHSVLAITVNSGELRIPYPVPVCVTGNLWLVKFNGFILQFMAKTNHKFPVTQTGMGYGIRSSPEFTVMSFLSDKPYPVGGGGGGGL